MTGARGLSPRLSSLFRWVGVQCRRPQEIMSQHIQQHDCSHFDQAAHTLRVEYDATRLSAADVLQLARQSGLQVVEEVPLTAPPPAPEPAPAA